MDICAGLPVLPCKISKKHYLCWKSLDFNSPIRSVIYMNKVKLPHIMGQAKPLLNNLYHIHHIFEYHSGHIGVFHTKTNPLWPIFSRHFRLNGTSVRPKLPLLQSPMNNCLRNSNSWCCFPNGYPIFEDNICNSIYIGIIVILFPPVIPTI